MKKRLAGLQKAMPEEFGAVLVTSPINRRYYTGFRSSAGVLLVTRKKSYFITDSRYHEAAEKLIEGCTVLLQDKLLLQIKKLLTQHRVKTLGIEAGFVSVAQLREYETAFEGIEIVTDSRLDDIIAAQRAIKTADEIAAVRAAQKIADAAFLHILGFIEVGKSERDIAAELEIFCLRNGADGMSFSTIIASGPNSSVPHHEPGTREIMTGDFVTMDFGCLLGGYCSDMTRTVAVGAVSPKQKELYETVLAAQLASVEAVKGGVACMQVDKVARDIIEASEFKGNFNHGLGHCLGLEVHENPRCNTISKDTLLPGMITSVEPGIYLAGEFGVRIEDIVVVTQKGCENLCSSPKELIIL